MLTPPDTDIEGGYDPKKYDKDKVYFVGFGERSMSANDSARSAQDNAMEQISKYSAMYLSNTTKKDDTSVTSTQTISSQGTITGVRVESTYTKQEEDGSYSVVVLVSVPRSSFEQKQASSEADTEKTTEASPEASAPVDGQSPAQ